MRPNLAQWGKPSSLEFSAHLKSRTFTCKLLIVQHGFQDFLVSSRHQTNSTHDFQNSHFGLDVLGGQALSDDVDAFWMSEHMGTSLRVVHQGFNAADQWGVDLRFGGLVVHCFQEVQDARQSIEVYEACHKPWGAPKWSGPSRWKDISTQVGGHMENVNLIAWILSAFPVVFSEMVTQEK